MNQLEDLCGYGYTLNEFSGKAQFTWHYADGIKRAVLNIPQALHIAEILKELPQFKTYMKFKDYDHSICLEKDSMHYAEDSKGIVRMVLLKHIVGNTYSRDQVLLVRVGREETLYKINDMTELSAPKSCMLYVEPIENK